MIRRAGQREKPASAPFSQDGWRAEVVERQFHVIMILEVERHADSQPQIFPTSDERAFTPSSDSGWKMLDTCSTSASPIQQPDSRSFRPDSITLIGDFCTFGVMLFGW